MHGHQVPPDHVAQAVAHAADAGELPVVIRQHRLVPVLDHLHEQVALVREIAVYAALDDIGPLGDVGKQGLLVTLFDKDLARGPHDFGDPLLPWQAYRPPAARHRHACLIALRARPDRRRRANGVMRSPSGITSEPFCLSMDLLSSRCREAARSANSPLTYTSLSSLIKTIHHSLISRKRHSKGVVKLPGGWRAWE